MVARELHALEVEGSSPSAATIAILASEPKYADHLEPVAAALGISVTSIEAPRTTDRALVASHRDLQAARVAGYRRFARIEHGIGQSYAGDPAHANASAYAGGSDAGDVELFLVPNVHAAERWSTAYPQANVDIVGCPKLDTLPARGPRGPEPTIAVSFHWDNRTIPEARSALDEYRDAVGNLARRYRVLGHGHPWLFRRGLATWYEKVGIEPVEDFADVVRRADLYVCDNSSTLYEAAWAGLPVLTLNSWHYRRGISHGLRFWQAIPGLVCDRPRALAATLALALEDPPEARAARAHALELAYGRPDGTVAAAEALRKWAASP